MLSFIQWIGRKRGKENIMTGNEKIKLKLYIGAVIILIGVFAAFAFFNEGSAVNTVWSLVPPVVAIVLALVTKEVYSSLFIGIATGFLFYFNLDVEKAFVGIFQGAEIDGEMTAGMIPKISDSWNAGILMFLVMLGILVVMINKAGGSEAYGKWAQKKIKSKRTALLATFGLGVLIFVDDYFNCLTVGSVMRPITDKYKISRAKLAYIIDATAAPICIIAPISSWAAAVTGVVEGTNGLELFIKAVPYNLYAILTIVMVIAVSVMGIDIGSMREHEKMAEEGDLFGGRETVSIENTRVSSKGGVIDLVMPVIMLIIFCVFGMIYSGGFFDINSENYHSFVSAFADSNASIGLVIGSAAAVIITFVLYITRGILSFNEIMDSFPEGFKAMVPAILILTFAWTLSGVTNLLGADQFVAGLLKGSAENLNYFLPAVLFAVAFALAFSTGTSWGTFGVLLPIIVPILPVESEILIIAISSCLAGAVCGDHCSPISDTTIMASTGAQCNHLSHVTTQIPYVLVVAAVSMIGYVMAGFMQSVAVLPISIIILLIVLVFYKKVMMKE